MMLGSYTTVKERGYHNPVLRGYANGVMVDRTRSQVDRVALTLNHSVVSRTQHLITQIQDVCQEIHDIKKNRRYQNPPGVPLKPQTNTETLYGIQDISSAKGPLNTPSSPQQIKPAVEELPRLQRLKGDPNPIPQKQLQEPQNQTKHPSPKISISEKSVHNMGTTSAIDLKSMNPTIGDQNHPTAIFSGFMDKEWGKIQTEGRGKGQGGKSDHQLPCHLIQPSESSKGQKNESGMSQDDSGKHRQG